MKILFVAPRFHTNQVPIVKTLKQKGHEVNFVTQYIGGSEDHSIIQPIRLKYSWFFRLRLSRYKAQNPNPQDPFKFERKFGAPSFFSLLKLFLTIKPDLIIIRDRHTKVSRFAFVISKILHKNTILYVQIPVSELKMGFSETSILTRYFDYFFLPKVVISPLKGLQTEKAISRYNIYYLPLIAEPYPNAENHVYFRNNRINILNIGKFVPRKCHLLLIKSLESIVNLYPIHLTIIGEASTPNHLQELKTIQQYIELNNLSDYVDIKINLDYLNVLDEYFCNDLFVMPAKQEPMAISPIEAMAARLPVICSDTSGTSEYIEAGRNGYVFITDDQDDLMQKILLIIKDRKTLVEMAGHSLDIINRKFSSDAYYNKFMDIIQAEFHTIK